jgi:hypothetical protein
LLASDFGGFKPFGLDGMIVCKELSCGWLSLGFYCFALWILDFDLL